MKNRSVVKLLVSVLLGGVLLCASVAMPASASAELDFKPCEVLTDGNYALTATVTASKAMDDAGLRKTLAHVVNASAHDEGWIVFENWGKEQWIQLTLAEPTEVNTWVMWPRSTLDANRNSCFPRRFKLMAQLEDGTWETVLDYSENKWPALPPAEAEPDPQVMTFETVKATALKMECYDYYPAPNDLGGGDGAPIYWIEEIGIYRQELASAPTTTTSTTTTTRTTATTATTSTTATTQNTDTVFEGDDAFGDGNSESNADLPIGAVIAITAAVSVIVCAAVAAVVVIVLKKKRK